MSEDDREPEERAAKLSRELLDEDERYIRRLREQYLSEHLTDRAPRDLERDARRAGGQL